MAYVKRRCEDFSAMVGQLFDFLGPVIYENLVNGTMDCFVPNERYDYANQ